MPQQYISFKLVTIRVTELMSGYCNFCYWEWRRAENIGT